jgi:hypothetical protein
LSNVKAVPIDRVFQHLFTRILKEKRGASGWRPEKVNLFYYLPRKAVAKDATTSTASVITTIPLEAISVPLFKRTAKDLFVLVLVTVRRVVAFRRVLPIV